MDLPTPPLSSPSSKRAASPSPAPRVDSLDAFTLLVRVVGFLALSGVAIAYLFQGQFLFASAFAFVAFLVQWRAIALLRKLRENALESISAPNVAPDERPDGNP